MPTEAENFLHSSVISFNCSSIFSSFSTFIFELDISIWLIDAEDGCLTFEKVGLGMFSSHLNVAPAFVVFDSSQHKNEKVVAHL